MTLGVEAEPETGHGRETAGTAGVTRQGMQRLFQVENYTLAVQWPGTLPEAFVQFIHTAVERRYKRRERIGNTRRILGDGQRTGAHLE